LSSSYAAPASNSYGGHYISRVANSAGTLFASNANTYSQQQQQAYQQQAFQQQGQHQAGALSQQQQHQLHRQQHNNLYNQNGLIGGKLLDATVSIHDSRQVGGSSQEEQQDSGSPTATAFGMGGGTLGTLMNGAVGAASYVGNLGMSMISDYLGVNRRSGQGLSQDQVIRVRDDTGNDITNQVVFHPGQAMGPPERRRRWSRKNPKDSDASRRAEKESDVPELSTWGQQIAAALPETTSQRPAYYAGWNLHARQPSSPERYNRILTPENDDDWNFESTWTSPAATGATAYAAGRTRAEDGYDGWGSTDGAWSRKSEPVRGQGYKLYPTGLSTADSKDASAASKSFVDVHSNDDENVVSLMSERRRRLESILSSKADIIAEMVRRRKPSSESSPATVQKMLRETHSEALPGPAMTLDALFRKSVRGGGNDEE